MHVMSVTSFSLAISAGALLWPQRKPLAISEGQGRGAPAAWRPGSPWPLMMHTGWWLIILNHNFDHLHHSLGSSSSWSDFDLWKWMYPQTSMGALTLAASLKRVNTSRKLAIMVTSEGWLLIQYCHHHQWWFTKLVTMVAWLHIQRRTILP